MTDKVMDKTLVSPFLTHIVDQNSSDADLLVHD